MTKQDSNRQEPDNNKQQPDNLERRVFNIEMRAAEAGEEGDKRSTVTGYAALFNSPSEDMGFIEIIEPGAFSEAIATSDVRALFNHDPNLILARTASGTLKVWEDDRGLRYEFTLPETTFGNDFRVMLERGDVSQSSFAFSVKEQAWETKKMENGELQYTRRVKKVERLYDVSPVTYPAYAETEVALRSIPITTEKKEQPRDLRSRRLELLEKYEK
jgi:HK97 family phage prohead protease